MESLSDTKLIKFHLNTMAYLRKQYNLDKPGQMDEAIDLLDGWIKKQNHFTVRDFPRSYLERQIILDKGSVERAKRQIEKLFTLKTVLPHFYTVHDVKSDYGVLKDVFIQTLMPILTEDHYRIYIGRITGSFNSNSLTLSYKIGASLFEYIKANEYCNGFIGILDYRDISVMDFITVLNVVELRQFATLMMEGYQMRLKAIHIVTSSKAVELLVKIFRSVFSTKIGNRIQVHMNLDSLHQHVPKELLPKDMGGDQKSLPSLCDDFIETLSTKQNMEYFKEYSKTCIDEKWRCSSNNYMEEALGMSGTFRTLSVD